MSKPGRFPLGEDEEIEGADEVAVASATLLVRALLQRDDVSGAQVVALGKALDALESMPEVTEGTMVEVCVQKSGYREGNSVFWNLRVSETELELTSVETFYDPAVGGDNETRLSYLLESQGYRGLDETGTRIDYWFREARDALEHGADVTITDESDE